MSSSAKQLAFAVVVGALAVADGGHAQAQTTPAQQAAEEQATARKLEEGWLRSQLRVFRAYPHLDKTYRLLEDGKTEEAGQELQTYLAINPGDQEARILDLSILYQLKRHGEVIDRADRMLAEQAGTSQVLLYRALSRLALKQFEAGVADLSAVAADKTASKEDVDFALGMITDVAIARQDYRTAQEALDRLADQPKDFGYYFRRGLIAAGQQRYQDADTAYRQALAAASDPKQRLRALREIAENAKRLKDDAAARRAYSMALELSPNDPALMRELANLDYAGKNYEGAIGWIRKVIAVKPSFADREFLANLLYQTGSYADAIQEYNRLLPECPDDAARARVYLAIGYGHRALQQDRQAAEAFQAAAKISPDISADLALSQALEAKGDIQQAIDALTAAAGQQPSSRVEAQLGMLYGKLGDNERSLTHLNAALRDSTLPAEDRWQVETARGYAAMALGKNDQAIEAFRSAVRLKADVPTRLALAQALENAGQVSEAAQVVEAALKQQPSAQLRARLGLLYAKLGKDRQAAELLAGASREPDLAADDRYRLRMAQGYALLKSGQTQEALAAFQAAAAIRSDAPALLALAQAQENAGQPRQAIDSLEQISRTQTTPDIEARLGLLYGKLGEGAKALPHLRAADQVQGLAPEDRHRVLMTQGFGYLSLGRNDDAVRSFRAAAEIKADQPTLLALSQAYDNAGETKLAIRTLEGALGDRPSADLRLRLALLHLKAGDQAQAVALLRDAARDDRSPGTQRLALQQLGYLYAGRGLNAEARQTFEQAVALSPKDPALLSALGEVYLSVGAIPEAISAFERSLALRETPATLSALAGAYVRGNDYRKAEATYRKLLAAPRLPAAERAQAWESLGYVYGKLGQNRRASEAFSEAIATGGNERQVRLSLGSTLAKMGMWQDALVQFQRANELQQSAQSLLFIAQSYRALKQQDRALDYLNRAAALQDQLSPGERRDLYNELGYIYADERQWDQAIAMWRQSLAIENDPAIALALGRTQRHTDPAAARQTLEAIPAFALPPNLQAERLGELAAIYAGAGELERALEAQAQATRLAPTAAHEYQLAVFYRDLDRPEEALTHYRTAAELDPGNPQYALDLGYAYIQAGQVDKGREVFQDLAARAPSSAEAAAVNKQLGYLYLKEGDTDRAVDSFKRAIDALRAPPVVTSEGRPGVPVKPDNPPAASGTARENL